METDEEDNFVFKIKQINLMSKGMMKGVSYTPCLVSPEMCGLRYGKPKVKSKKNLRN